MNQNRDDSLGLRTELVRAQLEFESVPLSPAQRRLWIIEQLRPGNAAYHIPICLRLMGALDSKALERSLFAIVNRHQPLRTTFAVRDGVPVQLIKPFGYIAVELHD